MTDTTAHPTRLDPADLRDWPATDATVRVLDVRSPAEFEAVPRTGAPTAAGSAPPTSSRSTPAWPQRPSST